MRESRDINRRARAPRGCPWGQAKRSGPRGRTHQVRPTGSAPPVRPFGRHSAPALPSLPSPRVPAPRGRRGMSPHAVRRFYCPRGLQRPTPSGWVENSPTASYGSAPRRAACRARAVSFVAVAPANASARASLAGPRSRPRRPRRGPPRRRTILGTGLRWSARPSSSPWRRRRRRRPRRHRTANSWRHRAEHPIQLLVPVHARATWATASHERT